MDTVLPKGARIAKPVILNQVGLPCGNSFMTPHLQGASQQTASWWLSNVHHTGSCWSSIVTPAFVGPITMHHLGVQAAAEVDLTALPTPTTPRHNIRICPTNRAHFAAMSQCRALCTFASTGVLAAMVMRVLAQASAGNRAV